jgi:hypothetical protein
VRPTKLGPPRALVSRHGRNLLAKRGSRCQRAILRLIDLGQGAMDEYLACQDAERAKMAKLREMRFAAEAVAGKAEAKRGRGKAKR